MTYKDFTAVTSTVDDFNTYLMDQVIVRTDSARNGIVNTPGRCIYEQDTGCFLAYTTATTGWILPWFLPRGYLFRAGGTNNRVIPTAAGVVVTTATAIPLYVDRKYIWHANIPVELAAGANSSVAYLSLYYGGSPTTVGSGTLVATTSREVLNGTAHAHVSIYAQMPLPSLATGTYDFRWDVSLASNAGTSLVNPDWVQMASSVVTAQYDIWSINIEDVGPRTTTTPPP